MNAVRELDLDAEQEVDLGRYGRTLAQRWWLPVVGLVAGAIVGYLLSLGGGTSYRAQALVYLGQPLGILGGSAVASPNTNPAAAHSIVTSESVIQQVAHEVGLSASKLRSGVSTGSAQAPNPKVIQNSLVQVTVKSSKPAKARRAANALGRILVRDLSGYSKAKVSTLTALLTADRNTIAAINAALARASTPLETKLLLQIQLAQRQQDATQTAQLLSLAKNIESPRILTRAAAAKTTARSHRNSTAVGGLIGLILGGIAALVWDPLVERRRARR